MSEVVQHAKEIGQTILPYWPVAAVPLGLIGFSKFLSWLIPGSHHNAKLDVRDKTVLITGASSGLGRALAFEFYKRGAKVIVVARSIDKLSHLCAELESAKAEFGWKNQHEPVYRYLDLSELGDEASAKQQIDDLKSLAIDGKTIDVLVNNAGMSMRGGCVETPIRIQRQLMDVNFFGHVLITKLLYDSIPDDGAIIVINSLQGKVALPYRSAYSASKHALQAFFDSLRAEDRPNLQILTINAGYINTGFGSRAVDTEGRAMGKEDQNQAQGMSPEEAASTIVKALIRRESELLMASFKHRFAIALRYFTPNLLNWLLHKRGQTDSHRKAEMPLDPTITNDIFLLYIVSGTLFIVVVVVATVLIQQRKQRLNWYEQNLLEIATSPPHYIRCKAIPRLDTDDDREYDRSPRFLERQLRKQSRIQKIVPTPALGDLSNAFTVPKMQKSINSMFQNPDQSQIDRGMYQTTMDAESEYDEESCGVGGSIKISLFVDLNLGLLTVALKQAVDLLSKRQEEAPNPYFKVKLDIPESSEPKSQQQSKIYKNTSSPIIEEEFFFQIPTNLINQCRLEIMVYDYDQFSVNECIGYCWLTLGRIAISTFKETPTVFFAEVLPFDDDPGNGFGEILLSLTYLQKAQRLTVNVFKARNLKIDDNENFSSVAIRIALIVNNDKKLKRKKTSSKKNTRNPQFNESLCFGIPKHSLCDSLLEIEAVHEGGTFGMTCKILGRIDLPLHKCRDLWRSIIHEEKSQARWHSLEEP